MNKPKISVVVPVYNVERYLPRCIESILDQSFTDFELLLVVDGSPDNSEEVCRSYELKDTRIRLIVKENGGVSSARNKGLDLAAGEWIVFIDSDDWIEKDFLNSLHRGVSEAVDMVELRQEKLKKNDFYTYLSDKFTFSVWNKMFRSSIISDIRFHQNLKIGEDLIFLLQVFQKSQRINVLKTPVLYNYFIREDSAMNTIRSQVDSYIKLSRFLFDTVGSDYMYLPIYYRFLADNRNEKDKVKMKILWKSTLGKIKLKEYVVILFKDPVLLGKCIVRTLKAF